MEQEFDYDFLKLEAEEKMENAIKAYEQNISKIQTGRANPQVLNSIHVNYYGTPTPLNQIASISIPEPRQLLVKPYDLENIQEIMFAINTFGLGVQAVNEGAKIRITYPEMTTDRRKKLIKSLSKYTELARVCIRAVRQDFNKQLKASKQTEDDEKNMLIDIQKLTDKFIEKVNKITKEKEDDLISI